MFSLMTDLAMHDCANSAVQQLPSALHSAGTVIAVPADMLAIRTVAGHKLVSIACRVSIQ